MNLEQRIIDCQANLNFNEQQASKWLYQNKQRLNDYAMADIAEQIHMSKSFVSKLMKKLGYSSFAEFKVELKNEQGANKQESLALIDIQKKDLSETERLLRQTNFEKIFELIEATEIIYCYGTGHTQQNYMRELSRNLMCIGSKRVIYLSGKSELESILSTATAQDCLIVSSNSGEGTSLMKVVDELCLRGVSIISITSFASSRLVRVSDYNLFYVSTPLVNPLNHNPIFSFLPLNLCIDTLIRKYLTDLSFVNEGKHV